MQDSGQTTDVRQRDEVANTRSEANPIITRNGAHKRSMGAVLAESLSIWLHQDLWTSESLVIQLYSIVSARL